MTRRRRRVLTLLVLFALFAGVGTWLALSVPGGRVAAFQARLDRDEPGWRWTQQRADFERQLPPPGTGSMPLVRTLAAAGKPYSDWLSARDKRLQTGGDWLPAAEPNRRPPPLTDAEAGCLRDDLLPALAPARKLADHPGPGGEWLVWGPDPLGTLLPHLNDVRTAGMLFRLDAAAAALAGDPDTAVVASRAALGTARAVGPEPFLISLLLRRASGRFAADAAERTLALAEPAAGLAELQADLLAEADGPSLAVAAKADRACMNELYDNFRTGRDSIPAFVARYGLAIGVPAPAHALHFRFLSAGEQLAILEHTTGFVRAAEAPEHQRLAAMDALPARPFGRSVVGRLTAQWSRFGLTHRRFVELDLCGVARLRAAAAGVACERFRLKHGRWPESLAELGPLLPAVPNDPFTGTPLVYRRTPGGAVVYAVGLDGRDDGGNVGDDAAEAVKATGLDIGFRLFDPDRRNRPAEGDEP